VKLAHDLALVCLLSTSSGLILVRASVKTFRSIEPNLELNLNQEASHRIPPTAQHTTNRFYFCGRSLVEGPLGRGTNTMPPKGGSTKLSPMRLPPLPKLRVRRPNQADANPCLTLMSSVLSMFPSCPIPILQHWKDCGFVGEMKRG
jgi:hypothetical protein